MTAKEQLSRPQTETPSRGRNVLPLNPTSTAKKIATMIPFTSTSIERDESLIAIGREISKHIVGPIPANEFLRFLPKAQERRPKPTKSFQVEITKVTNATRERSMYKPFIHAMSRYCPSMRGRDTSDNPARTFSGRFMKPDFMYYGETNLPEAIADIHAVEMIGEAKLEASDDPFVDDVSKPFQSEFDRPVQAKGQVTSYSIAQLGDQFRTHVFSFLLFKSYIRLMRWDRAGLVVSESIELTSPKLAEFFWRYSHADPSARGVDTTVKPYEETSNLTKEYLFEQLKFGEDDKDLTVDSVKFFRMTMPSGNAYIIGNPTFLGVSSLVSRATRTFKAWCIQTGKAVFLKDTWRIFSGSQKPEHEIYEKLAKAKVNFIPTVLDSGDISEQQTRSGLYAKKKWANKCQIHNSPVSFRTLQHYRLVLKEIGRSLPAFKDLPEALTALANALQAYREAYYVARVLHRDISAGNIIIYSGKGLLIDWEMSRDLDADAGPPNITRTGTWAFQSLELQLNYAAPIEHKRHHDLESFYHVLCWFSLRYARHGLSGEKLVELLQQTFEASVELDGNSTASLGKEAHMNSKILTKQANFKNQPLAFLLEDLGEIFRSLYAVVDKPRKETEEALEDYTRELKRHERRFHTLTSDEIPNWAEDLVLEAATRPASEWGESSRVVHELPPPKVTGKRKFTDMMTSKFPLWQTSEFSVGEEKEEEAGGDSEVAVEDGEDEDEEYDDDDEDDEVIPHGGINGRQHGEEYRLAQEVDNDEDLGEEDVRVLEQDQEHNQDSEEQGREKRRRTVSQDSRGVTGSKVP